MKKTTPTITPAIRKAVISELMSELSRRRKTKRGGRPRDPNAPRCPCGAMTVKAAAVRCHKCTAPDPNAEALEGLKAFKASLKKAGL